MEVKIFLRLFIVATIAASYGQGQTINMINQTYYDTMGFMYGLTNPKPEFERNLYKATVQTDGVLQLEDGPIILDKCGSFSTTFQLFLDESKYHPVLPPPPAYPSIGNCSVLISHIILRKNATQERSYFMDVIKLQAIYDVYVIAETNIIVTSPAYYDPFRLSYSSNGTEYIILNYFYFKVFLAVIVCTSMAILLIEIREIYLKCKAHSYSELQNSLNYI